MCGLFLIPVSLPLPLGCHQYANTVLSVPVALDNLMTLQHEQLPPITLSSLTNPSP